MGTTKLPPPLPINPAKNPRILPAKIPNKNFCFEVKFFRLGFHPESISKAAEAVKRAKVKITGFTEIFELMIVPTGGKITIEMPKGIATFNSGSFFLIYVKAADEEFTTFKSIPRGIA